MKICVYLEFDRSGGEKFFKNVGTGILSSYRNQRDILKLLNIPFVEQWDDSCDILQTNTPWPRALMLMRKVRKQNKKVVMWAHVTAEDAKQVFRFGWVVFPLIKKYLAYAYGKADVVFCPTEYTKTLLINYGIPKEKLVAMSNGVDLTKFYSDTARRESGRSKYKLDTLTIGTVGQVNWRKGIDTFLAVAEKLPANQFLWVGNFFSKLIVKPLPKVLPKNVQFTGYVQDVLEGFSALDIFVFPSYEENQGMAILEAAAVGLPILVRDIPAYNGWLIDGENCLKAKNNEEFVTQLNKLVSDSTLRERLKEGSKNIAHQNSIPEIARKTLEIYQNLLK